MLAFHKDGHDHKLWDMKSHWYRCLFSHSRNTTLYILARVIYGDRFIVKSSVFVYDKSIAESNRFIVEGSTKRWIVMISSILFVVHKDLTLKIIKINISYL